MMHARETIERIRAQVYGNRNDAAYWWPLVWAAPVRSPKTQVYSLPLEHQRQLVEALDAGDDVPGDTQAYLAELITLIQSELTARGGRGFLRTGTTALKHRWRETCALDTASREQIQATLVGLIRGVWAVGASPSETLMVRERIPVAPAFHAFNDMPITREFRLFASRDKGLIACQPYWPEWVIRDPDTNDWRARLAAISQINDVEIREMARGIASIYGALDEPWAFDFLQDARGQWWLIDMAAMEASFFNHDQARMLI